jgi:hypothetical protein
MTDINNETTDGWTRLPTPTNDATSSWDSIPAPPPLPPTVFKEPDHASLHWSYCYNDYCETHRHAKDNNNYHPRRAEGSRRRGPRRQQACECNAPHPHELASAIRTKHLNPRKACADWNKGKRVCKACGYLVRLEGHEERCGANASPPAEVKTEEEENEAPPAAHENEDPENLAIGHDEAPDIGNLIRTTAIAQQLATISLVAAQRVIVDHQTQLAPRLERQDADHEQLGRMIHEVRQIATEQRRVTNQLNAQRRDWLNVRLRASRIQRPSFRASPPRRTPNLDLAGASVWRGGVLSRIWRDRLLGAVAGAAITAAGLWVVAVSAATISYASRR